RLFTHEYCSPTAISCNFATLLRHLAPTINGIHHPESREPPMSELATQPRRLENLHTDKGKVPVYATGVVEQPWDAYTATDHDVWRRLYARQRELLLGRASEAFLQAQDAMGMTLDAIPRFSEINQVLSAATGWTLIGVEGLLPELDFFDHLANRRFPVTWWIRKPGQFDYIEEPDLFHDLFGHVPLLMNPVF